MPVLHQMDCPALAVPVAPAASVALVAPAASVALAVPAVPVGSAASLASGVPVALVALAESVFLQMGCPALEVLALSPVAVFQPALLAQA